MANIYFKCENCQKSLAVDETGAGRTVECSDCGKPITVPHPELECDCNCGETMLAPGSMAGGMIQCVDCKGHLEIPAMPKITPSITQRTKLDLPFKNKVTQESPPRPSRGLNFRTGKEAKSAVDADATNSLLLKLIVVVVSVLVVCLIAGWAITGKGGKAEKTPSVSAQTEKPSKSQKLCGLIKGGVWITKRSGTSDIVRGMDIYLYKRLIPTDSIQLVLRDTKKALEEQIQFAQDSPLKEYISPIILIKQNNLKAITAQLRRMETDADIYLLYDILADARWSAIEYACAVQSAKMDGKKDYDSELKLRPDHIKIMGQLAGLARAENTQTDIDGKYRFINVPEGHYVVYGLFEAGKNVIEWCKCITVSRQQETTLDLHNENVSHIWGKPTDK